MTNNTILPTVVGNKYSKEIALIRNYAQQGKIKISNHAYQQLAQRKIKISDVYESVKYGTIMEIQNLESDTKILFQDCINKPPSFFSVVAVKTNMGLCITAYLPDPNKWVLGSNLQWRRK